MNRGLEAADFDANLVASDGEAQQVVNAVGVGFGAEYSSAVCVLGGNLSIGHGGARRIGNAPGNRGGGVLGDGGGRQCGEQRNAENRYTVSHL